MPDYLLDIHYVRCSTDFVALYSLQRETASQRCYGMIH